MSEPVEIYSGRTIPMTGTEADRVLTIPFRKPHEIHTTTQDRTWKNDVLQSPPIHHADVATEALMLALNTGSANSSHGVPVGCHPGDYVDRTDTGTRWTCISNYGELLSDWAEDGSAAIGSQYFPISVGDMTDPGLVFLRGRPVFIHS